MTSNLFPKAEIVSSIDFSFDKSQNLVLVLKIFKIIAYFNLKTASLAFFSLFFRIIWNTVKFPDEWHLVYVSLRRFINEIAGVFYFFQSCTLQDYAFIHHRVINNRWNISINTKTSYIKVAYLGRTFPFSIDIYAILFVYLA